MGEAAESTSRFDIHLAAALVPSEAVAAQEKGGRRGATQRWRPDICRHGALYSARMHGRLRATLAVAVGLLCACGSTASPTPSATPSPTPPPATAAPTPPPGPETQRVDVVATGVGVYELTTIPVAVVHNLATRSAATSVQVRFAVLNSAGKPIGGADANIPFIAPGQTTGIAARIEQSGSGLRATATVLGAQWIAANPTPPLTVDGTGYTCGTCRPGPGYGTAAGTLHAAVGVTVSSVTLTAVCYAGDAITGGDTSPETVTALPKPVQEPVIISAVPTRCDMYASPGS
jgi:hypothetical protein